MKDSVVAAGNFVQLRMIETENYRYEYSIDARCDGQLVAVLPLFNHIYGDPTGLDADVIVHMEMTPAWGRDESISPNSITGGVEAGKHNSPVDAAIAELREEAGIVAVPSQLYSLGTCHTSKSNASEYHLFMYLMNDGERKEYPEEYRGAADGSYMEQQEWSVMMSMGDAIEQSPDPLLAIMYARWIAGMMEPLDGWR